MADKAQTIVTLSPQQAAARQIAEEMAEMEAKGIKLNETIPGGKFEGADGTLHNSEGQPIDEDGNVLDEQKAAEASESKAAAKKSAKKR